MAPENQIFHAPYCRGYAQDISIQISIRHSTIQHNKYSSLHYCHLTNYKHLLIFGSGARILRMGIDIPPTAFRGMQLIIHTTNTHCLQKTIHACMHQLQNEDDLTSIAIFRPTYLLAFNDTSQPHTRGNVVYWQIFVTCCTGSCQMTTSGAVMKITSNCNISVSVPG